MGNSFAKGELGSAPELARIYTLADSAEAMEVRAEILKADQFTDKLQREGTSFACPSEGCLLRVSLGAVTVLVDSNGNTTIWEGGETAVEMGEP
jgi:hypothetical protein